MAGDTLFVFVLIGVASLLFASGRVRLDLVALGVLLALALSGVLTPAEAVSGFGDPVVIRAAGLGLFLSNTATAVLVAPIAIEAARVMGVDPYVFAMTVAIAASAAFMTPVSTPVVTLVVEPGGYRFADFLKIGIPLVVLTWLVTLLVTPLVFGY